MPDGSTSHDSLRRVSSDGTTDRLQRVIIAGDEQQAITQQRLADDSRHVRPSEPRSEGDIGEPFGQKDAHLPGAGDSERRLDVRCPPIERLQQRWSNGVADIRRGDDTQQVRRTLPDAHRLLRGDRQVDHLGCQADHTLPRRRQRQRSAGALDERVTEALAERADRL